MQAHSHDQKGSTLSVIPVTELFNHRADAAIVGFKEFWARPIRVVFQQVLKNPDDPLSLHAYQRLTEASAEEKKSLKTDIEAILRKETSKRSPAENLLTFDEKNILDAANRDLTLAQIEISYNPSLPRKYKLDIKDKLLQSAEQKNPIAQATLRNFIELVYVSPSPDQAAHKRKEKIKALHCPDTEKLPRILTSLHEAAIKGEPLSACCLYQLYAPPGTAALEEGKLEPKPLIASDEKKAEMYLRIAIQGGEKKALLFNNNFSQTFECYNARPALAGYEVIRDRLYFESIFTLNDPQMFSLLRDIQTTYDRHPTHPETVYHLTALLSHPVQPLRAITSSSIQEALLALKNRLENQFNELAQTQPEILTTLLSWETQRAQTRIFNLLNEKAKATVIKHIQNQKTPMTSMFITAARDQGANMDMPKEVADIMCDYATAFNFSSPQTPEQEWQEICEWQRELALTPAVNRHSMWTRDAKKEATNRVDANASATSASPSP